MRIPLIVSVLALTAGTFYSAVQLFPATTESVASTGEIAELQSQITQAEASRAAVDQQVLDLNTAVNDLTAQNQDRVAALDASVAENAELRSALDAAIQRSASLEAENTDLSAGKDELNQQLATLMADIESRENALRDGEAATQTLSATLDQERQEIDVLQATITDLELERDALTQKLTDLEATTAEAVSAAGDEQATARLQLETELANEIANLEARVSTLTAETSSLTGEVAQRDTIIVGLLERAGNAVAATDPTAAILATCQENSDVVLSSLTDIFEPGTATITAGSIPRLEEFAIVAIDCIENDLALEIEGHTGDSGGVASNLLLSDRRAKAVREFLVEQDVPAVAMRAVGFGGSDPVTDDDSSGSQSQNERIVFDWEQS